MARKIKEAEGMSNTIKNIILTLMIVAVGFFAGITTKNNSMHKKYVCIERVEFPSHIDGEELTDEKIKQTITLAFRMIQINKEARRNNESH